MRMAGLDEMARPVTPLRTAFPRRAILEGCDLDLADLAHNGRAVDPRLVAAAVMAHVLEPPGGDRERAQRSDGLSLEVRVFCRSQRGPKEVPKRSRKETHG